MTFCIGLELLILEWRGDPDTGLAQTRSDNTLQ